MLYCLKKDIVIITSEMCIWIYIATCVNLETNYLRMMKPFMFWHLLVLQSPLPCATLSVTLPSRHTDLSIPWCFMFSLCDTFTHTLLFACSIHLLFLCHLSSFSLAVKPSRVRYPLLYLTVLYLPHHCFVFVSLMILRITWLFFWFFTSTLQCLAYSLWYL